MAIDNNGHIAWAIFILSKVSKVTSMGSTFADLAFNESSAEIAAFALALGSGLLKIIEEGMRYSYIPEEDTDGNVGKRILNVLGRGLQCAATGAKVFSEDNNTFLGLAITWFVVASIDFFWERNKSNSEPTKDQYPDDIAERRISRTSSIFNSKRRNSECLVNIENDHGQRKLF